MGVLIGTGFTVIQQDAQELFTRQQYLIGFIFYPTTCM
jgi:hypothetical protein